MIRRLSTIASVLSLLLFILTLLLWADSFSRYYGIVYLPDHRRSFELYAVRGAIAFSVVDSLLQDGTAPGATRLRATVLDLQPGDVDYYAELGFAAGRFGELWFHSIHYTTPLSYNAPPERQRIVVAPFWFAALALVILPARSLRNVCIARRRRIAGRCVSCGYDLRASTGHCPECGAPIKSKADEAAA
jgi:hypothetical protein